MTVNIIKYYCKTISRDVFTKLQFPECGLRSHLRQADSLVSFHCLEAECFEFFIVH